MANSYNGHLILGDIDSFNYVYAADKEFRISELKQCMHRNRTEAGIQHSTTKGAFLDVRIDILPDPKTASYVQVLKPFYERLKSPEQYKYTVVYNRTLSVNEETARKSIASYDNGFVAKGYIVAIDEEYIEGVQSIQGGIDRISLNIKIQLSEICYLGDNHHNNKSIRIFA